MDVARTQGGAFQIEPHQHTRRDVSKVVEAARRMIDTVFTLARSSSFQACELSRQPRRAARRRALLQQYRRSRLKNAPKRRPVIFWANRGERKAAENAKRDS